MGRWKVTWGWKRGEDHAQVHGIRVGFLRQELETELHINPLRRSEVRVTWSKFLKLMST